MHTWLEFLYSIRYLASIFLLCTLWALFRYSWEVVFVPLSLGMCMLYLYQLQYLYVCCHKTVLAFIWRVRQLFSSNYKKIDRVCVSTNLLLLKNKEEILV